MKITIGLGQSFFIAKFESIKPSVVVEDDVKEGETWDEAYERINELCKFFFYKQVMQGLSDIPAKDIMVEINTPDESQYTSKLADLLIEKIEKLDSELLDKNDK